MNKLVVKLKIFTIVILQFWVLLAVAASVDALPEDPGNEVLPNESRQNKLPDALPEVAAKPEAAANASLHAASNIKQAAGTAVKQVLVGDPVLGKVKSEKCIACHGADGNATVTIWPKIAGQHQSYLYEQLLAFQQGQAGGRYEPSMANMVQGLSQQDLADLVAFYARQTIIPGVAKANVVALGATLYRGGNVKSGVPACIACHGANGMGNELAKFPRLSGQHAEYTANQLRNYKNKVRTNDANGIMQDIALRLSDEEIEAISSYVEGLH